MTRIHRLLLAVGCAVSSAASASSGMAAYASSTPLPVQIDGRIDEAVWAQAPLNQSFHQFQPDDKLPAPDGYRTTVQVLVDGEALVFAIRAWLPPGQAVNSALARRDKVGRDQDYIGIWLDPSGHGRSAQFVRVNASGVLSDGIFRSDENEEDLGPDFPIDSAVQRLADGYSMEVRWPLSSLRFARGQSRPWRVMIERSAPGADGLQLLSVPLKKEALSFIDAMQPMDGIAAMLPVVENKPYWYVRPELTVRRQSAGGSRTDSTSLGADISVRPRADWVINATLNPDFSQVEIDEPTNAGASQIALSLPEKRQFFLESADVLGMRLPGFYSRTVADPRWGVRATWRGPEADATALMLADRAGGVVMRGRPYATDEYVNAGDSTATLVRARWHREGSVAGVHVAHRDYGAGGVNTVAGIDGQASVHLVGEKQSKLTWSAMGSHTTALMEADGLPQRAGARDAAYLFAKVDHVSDDWFNIAQIEAIGPGFVNDNGFVPQSGVVKGEMHLSRRLGPRHLGKLTTYETELHLGLIEDRTLADAKAGVPAGEVVRRLVRTGFWLFAGRQTRVWGDLGFDHQRARTGAQLHRTPAVFLGWESSPLPWLVRFAGEVALGRRLDVQADRVGQGGNAQLEVGMRFGLAGGMSLESDHRFNRAWVRHAGREGFAEHGWRWVGTLHLSARDSVRLIAQQVASDRFAGTQVAIDPWAERQPHRSILYRYIHRHGRMLSVGATSDANGALQGRSKGVTVKLQWEV